MWLSLEILVPGQLRHDCDFSNLDITVVRSCPPKSHREGSSLWQSVFDEFGGTLFHLGDPIDIKVRQDRYYIYDAFDWSESGAVFVKLLPQYQRDFEHIVRSLHGASGVGWILVSTDVWLGPKSVRYKHPMPVDAFVELTRRKGIRKNSLRQIGGGVAGA
jgi:hypothetical protein